MIKPKDPIMDGLRQLMYTNFIVLKKYSLDKAVENWPDESITSTSSIYKWMEAIRDPSIKQIINLTIATKDSIYIEYIANQAGYSVIPQIKDRASLKVLSHLSKLCDSAINGNNDEKK